MKSRRPAKRDSWAGAAPKPVRFRYASSALNQPCLITTTFGIPVDPEVCSTIHGVCLASSKDLVNGYIGAGSAVFASKSSRSGISKNFIARFSLRAATIGITSVRGWRKLSHWHSSSKLKCDLISFLGEGKKHLWPVFMQAKPRMR